MVLNEDNPEPSFVQVLMTSRLALFLAVFCVRYIWSPCLLKGNDDEEEKGHEEAIAILDTESLSQWSHNFEKYNFFGKLCVLCVICIYIKWFIQEVLNPG
jgi:hypothetical protein